MSIVLHINEIETLDLLEKHSNRIRIEAYAADITDDGKVIQLHFDYGDFTNISLQDLLIAYMEKNGIAVKKRKG